MTAHLITTDKLQPGDKVEHRRNGDRFTVDSVTPSSTDWRFHSIGSAPSESGMEIVGHDADGETVYFTAAQSCRWWVIELAATTAPPAPASSSWPTLSPPERPAMPQPATLPLVPARLADLLLAPAADPNTLHQQLADQLTPRSARRLLAAAHHIAAERLWADAA